MLCKKKPNKRAWVYNESEVYVRYVLDVHAVVGFVMVIVGIVITGSNYKLLNLPIMKILNIFTGAVDMILSLSFVQKLCNVKVLYVLQLIMCILTCIFLFLSWAFYCDKHQLDDKESNEKKM